VLTLVDAADLSWVWTGPDPFAWSIQRSLDGVTGWSEYDEASGVGRTYSGIVVGWFYKVFGVDSGVVQVTPDSNVVDNT
jgi:hypothetical protein